MSLGAPHDLDCKCARCEGRRIGAKRFDEAMSCGLFKDRVGYKGQKYEVRFTDEDGKERVFGWQNQPEGGLAKSARITSWMVECSRRRC
jgi:hypothetical protein